MGQGTERKVVSDVGVGGRGFRLRVVTEVLKQPGPSQWGQEGTLKLACGIP